MPGAFPVLTFALAGFVLATLVQEFTRGVRARRALHGETMLAALANLFRRSGRRYGGYVVHLGIVLVAVGIAASQARAVEAERTLAPGDRMTAAGYTVELAALRDQAEPQRRRIAADLVVRSDRGEERLAPALLFYPFGTQAVASPGIRAELDADVYTILAAYDGKQGAWATIRVRIIPLVSWIWIGAGVVGLGALLAALPLARRSKSAVVTPLAPEAARRVSAAERAPEVDELADARLLIPARWRVTFAAIITLVVVLLIVLGSGFRQADPRDIRSALIGGPAPGFDLELLDGSGRFRLAEQLQSGKAVIVYFFASWCVPCKQEYPTLVRLWERYRSSDVVFVGVLFQDSRESGLEFHQRLGGTWPTVYDEGSRTALAFGVFGIPESYFISRDGTVVSRRIGLMEEATLVSEIEKTRRASSR